MTLLPAAVVHAVPAGDTSAPAIVAHQPSTSLSDTATMYEVPLLYDPLLNPLPMVEVRINRAEPLPFIVDTGFASIAVESWAARRLGLPTPPARPSGEKRVGGWVVPLRDFEVVTTDEHRPLRVNSAEALIVNDFIPKGRFARRPAGIIGLPLLKTATTRFDFAVGMITLSFLPHAPLHLAGATCLPLQIHLTDDGSPLCFSLPARVNGGELQMMLDTGAMEVHLPKSVGPALGSFRTGAVSVESRTVYGTDEGEEVELRSLRLGDQALTNLYALLAVRATAGKALLGMNVLSGFRVTFDPRNKQVWLEPAGGGTVDHAGGPAGITGILLEQRGEGDARGYYVSPQSEFRESVRVAGIAVGDRVISVDGQELSPLPPIVAKRVLYGFAGTDATVVLERASEPRKTVTFRRDSPFAPRPDAPKVGFGFTLIPGAKEGLEIAGMDPASPAEKAGLKVFDLIVSVDGVAVPAINDETLGPIAKLLHRPEGTEITLVIRRLGEQQTRTVKVKVAKLP